MKILHVALGGCLFLGWSAQARQISLEANPPTCRLTVELRDGSRVLGEADGKMFQFHSALLGEVKLAVKDIRSVECVSSNTARLTTVGGDSLTVGFADDRFALKTSFGKIEVAVASLRKFTVATAGAGGTRRPGLVALWSGEGDGKDSVGYHDAELTDITFAEGKVGRAFLFDGGSTLKVPSNPALDVGQGSGFTLGIWINPANVSKNNPLFEWVEEGVRCGTQFYIYPPNGGPGTLYALIGDTEGGAHYFHSSPGAVIPNAYQYVALTYDKATGIGKIYCNGTLVAQQNLGSFRPQTSCNLYLGKRPLIVGETYQFTGMLDEAAIYDRALSASEIREICIADNHDQPLPAPAARFPRVMPF